MLKEQHIQNSKNMITNYATNHAHQRVVFNNSRKLCQFISHLHLVLTKTQSTSKPSRNLQQ